MRYTSKSVGKFALSLLLGAKKAAKSAGTPPTAVLEDEKLPAPTLAVFTAVFSTVEVHSECLHPRASEPLATHICSSLLCR